MNLAIPFRRVVFVAFLLAEAPGVQAQGPVPSPNPNLNLNPPALSATIEYRSVAPGVTLHQTSPVLYFRGILGMTPVERERALAGKPAEAKKLLLAKVQEYTNLPANIREARLRQTQLRWELTSLTNLPPAARPAFIREAAPEDRPLLEGFDHWQALAPAEQEALLKTFTDAERRTMEEALNTFAALPEAQRKIWAQSFQKFLTMDADERDEFLKNAARWDALTPKERSLWRELVQRFPSPPLPPGFHPVPYPPLPPGMILYPPSPPGMKPPVLSKAPFPSAATNTNH